MCVCVWGGGGNVVDIFFRIDVKLLVGLWV